MWERRNHELLKLKVGKTKDYVKHLHFLHPLDGHKETQSKSLKSLCTKVLHLHVIKIAIRLKMHDIFRKFWMDAHLNWINLVFLRVFIHNGVRLYRYGLLIAHPDMHQTMLTSLPCCICACISCAYLYLCGGSWLRECLGNCLLILPSCWSLRLRSPNPGRESLIIASSYTLTPPPPPP